MGRQTLWAGSSRSSGDAYAFDSLPPSNMANYVTGEGALNLKSYKTRITGSLSYGWLSQNDYVFESTTAAGPPLPWLVDLTALRVSAPRLWPRILQA